MKKIKFMLFSLTILSFAGGVLAIEARYGGQFCTTNTIAGPGGAPICPANPKCPNLVVNSTTDVLRVAFCTTTPTTYLLDGQVVRLTCFEDNNPQMTLDCFDVARLKLE